jgi:hypothetical protein
MGWYNCHLHSFSVDGTVSKLNEPVLLKTVAVLGDIPSFWRLFKILNILNMKVFWSG